jgi:putative flippase GtrA
MTIVSLIHKIPRVFKFAIIGGLAACVHFLTEILLVELLKLHPLSANIFAFFIAFSVSFTGQHFFTFADAKRSIEESLPRFFVIAFGGFVLNQLLFGLALYLFPIPYYVSLLIVVLAVSLGTFFFSKLWAFKSH